MKRKTVTDFIGNQSISGFIDGKTKELCEYLQSLDAEHKYSKVYFEVDSYGEDYLEIIIKGEREEYDEEYEKRMKKEALDKENAQKSKEAQEKIAYETYLKLKEKYEGKK